MASDVAALLPVTRRFMFLEEGDIAEVRRERHARSSTRQGNAVERPVKVSELSAPAAEKGQYEHFMLKEIHEQPLAVANTLQERVANGRLLEAAFGHARDRDLPARGVRAHRGLRHQLSRRRGGAVLHRADLPHSLPRRDRQRIPLPQCRGAEEFPVRDHLAVGRDGRHAGGAAAGRSRAATSRRWRSAIRRKARWCANRTWCC